VKTANVITNVYHWTVFAAMMKVAVINNFKDLGIKETIQHFTNWKYGKIYINENKVRVFNELYTKPHNNTEIHCNASQG
jgi:hypothetical protein